tara:strand:- start:240 stop:365 length:126 start_codon:yes stop_codon:yes gene_type:complete
MILATIESFIGSLWFAGLTCLAGYIGGCIIPISKIKELISK